MRIYRDFFITHFKRYVCRRKRKQRYAIYENTHVAKSETRWNMLNFVYHSYYHSKRRTRCDDVGNDGVWCVVGVGSDERIQDGANCRVLGRRDCLGTLRECGRGFVDGTQRDGHGDVNVVGRVRHANHQVVRRRRGVIVDGCTNTLALRRLAACSIDKSCSTNRG